MRSIAPIVLALSLVGCARDGATPAAAPAATPEPAEAEAKTEPKYPQRPFFGDTHLHTGFSMDAGLFGATTDPRDAYRFARGEKVTASKGMEAQLARPLDFLVVADHSEALGFFEKLSEGDPEILAVPKGKQWYDGYKAGGQASVEASLDLIETYTAGNFPDEFQFKGEQIREPWEQMIAAAEEFNEPGKFTAFIGYEWTSMPNAQNLHRVVIFADGAEKAKQITPFSALDSDDPEELWKALGAYEQQTGGRVLAIPHNGNLSNGQMFTLETQSGQPFDKAYAETRIRYEPLYEITQIKGDGEAHPFLSPDDEFADFENWDLGNLDMSIAKTEDMLAGEYAREALKRGLVLEGSLGVNPFKFGVIGSTDSHTGLATADDNNFYGKHSGAEPSKERVDHPFIDNTAGRIEGWQMVASGYAAVWATENTRDAIFDAMMRKETYATTGPRMTLRFFGGWDFQDADLTGDMVAAGYERGVPMGGDLGAKSADAPTFIVAGMKESDGANLDRVQIVKGWVGADGMAQEKVYDVVWSGDRAPDAAGKVPAVGNTVNTDDCTYENTIGSAELMAVWSDPTFDPAQRAFYYVRMLEIPTPRWTAWDKLRFGSELGPEVPLTIQQRAYSSPIWYTPES